MTEALTKVDEKVGNFNNQVELLNKSQEGITKILAGVKIFVIPSWLLFNNSTWLLK